MSEARRRAVVVGGGIAGVTVARALADRFTHVIVFERDPDVVPRPHVPQLPHTHILGSHGYRLLCRMFEGFDADLAANGAPLFDYGESPFHAGRWAPQGSFGLVTRSATRPLFEAVLRRELQKHASVELVTGERVRTLVMSGDRVRAVRLDDGRELEADLIVDAMGVGSKTPAWLAEHGYPAPARTEVDLHGGVVSRMFKPAEGRGLDWVILNVRRSGGNLRHGVITWVEHGIWRVSVAGSQMRPPKELGDFAAFARALATPVIGELLEGAEPVSPAYAYNNNWSQWVHYEQLPRFPEGLIVIGGATFHPNYEHGQGMTFCAMTAELVADHLAGHELGQREGSSLAFQRALGAMVAPWWDWNLSVELVVPGAEAPPPSPTAQLRHRYFRLLRQAALGDAELWKAMLETTQSIRSPHDLLHASVLSRALACLTPPPSADEVRELESLLRHAGDP